jgi:hypothetical protein
VFEFSVLTAELRDKHAMKVVQLWNEGSKKLIRRRETHNYRNSFTCNPNLTILVVRNSSLVIQSIPQILQLASEWISVRSYTGYFKKSFTMVFQTLLCGECYEKVYTKIYLSIYQSLRGNYPSFKVQTHSNIWNTIVKLFWNTLDYQWKSHWAITISDKTRRVFLYSRSCICSMNKLM